MTKQKTCSHQHVLCVTCSAEADSTVMIRVQTNALPDHCWRTSFIPTVAQYKNDDFTVTWNANVAGFLNYSEADFSSTGDTESILCDIQRTSDSNMPPQIDYVDNGTGRLM